MWPQCEQLKLAALLFEQAQPTAPVNEDRRAAFRRARGRFKHLLPSVAEFQAEKRRELEVEERREAIRRVRGMLKGSPGAAEFHAEKIREREREERRYAERFGPHSEPS